MILFSFHSCSFLLSLFEGKASFGVDSDGVTAEVPKNLLCRSINGSVRGPAAMSKRGSG